MTTPRTITFTKDERKRLAAVCSAIPTPFEEFVRWATLQALDEMEALARDIKRIREYYERTS